ncbi:hypothetical protein [Emcibacter nanhaiensis]|uniref:Uncharacterized protein n=1 Tax=Emcibacter nanhaiensis TaxID=1505037 RepID=A0A501PQ88_9PROT|nr:hypothetical protein [Emcibacter nanhaiensis]TPD61956.1 hypothetical protein FIV46_07060 [Emcibacter nanhaiensis]
MNKTPSSYTKPRISANELALYMVSSDTARLNIIERAHTKPKAPIIRYRDVRPILCNYLSDRDRNVNRLIDAEAMFERRSQDPSQSPLMQNDASNSIDVLHSIQRMSNKLSPFNFSPAPDKQPKLVISGVQVSVRADLYVQANIKGTMHSGGAILRMSQDDADTPTAKKKRQEMGFIVATLIRMHLDNTNIGEIPIANKLCMSIDVQHGEAFQVPTANTQRQRNLESACQFIARQWDAF